jgi:hypothetical protein
MNTSKLADIAEIFSSVAILITLVFLVVQMQQNTQAIQTQTRESMYSGTQQQIQTLIEFPIYAELQDKPDWSAIEKFRTHLILTSAFRGSEFHWFQYQNDVIDEATFKSYSNAIPFFLADSKRRAWWRNIGRGAFDAGFVEYVDSLIEDRPITGQPRWLTAFD